MRSVVALGLFTTCLSRCALAIPQTDEKVTPDRDVFPPRLHVKGWEEPVPLPGPVNTAGVEDSPFIAPGGEALYFWFTPRVSVPPQLRLRDGFTGIYVAEKIRGRWSVPRRVILQDPGFPAMDGAPCLQGTTLWFCSVRQGNRQTADFYTARWEYGRWGSWSNVGTWLNDQVGPGELHVTAGGDELFFHAEKTGGKGKYDIWRCWKVRGKWKGPGNIEAVNSPESETQPFITPDGNELWFTRRHKGSPAIFRSLKKGVWWQRPELIVSSFAGEPSLDRAGNLYFVHHYYRKQPGTDRKTRMIESDIYVARKR